MVCLGALLLVCLVTSAACTTVRVVSWNVGDNKGMDGGLDRTALRRILGVEQFNVSAKAYMDIYAVTLQESCYACDEEKWQVISNLVLDELNREGYHKYEYIGHDMTRAATNCESWACSISNQHGTSVMYVFGRRGLLQKVGTYKVNKCMGGFFKNSEKGIAGVKVRLRNRAATFCFAGLHLDSKSPSKRRECFREFMEDHGEEWGACDATFYAGDFNTRTGDKGGPEGARLLSRTNVQRLRYSDEMNGGGPYGGRRLMDYLTEVHSKAFSEGTFLDFYPTYSMRPASECGGRGPCYRANRPPSWTDRIVCSPCNTFQYMSLPVAKSDHDPVFGIYTV